MLKISGCVPNQKTVLEFGDFVPLKIYSDSPNNNENFHWSTGDFDYSIIEFDISKENFKVLSINLIGIGIIKNNFPLINFDNVVQEVGFPIIDSNYIFSNNYLQESGLLNVFLDRNKILIAFSETYDVETILKSENVLFGLNSNNFLNWILIENLLQIDLQKIYDAQP